MNAVTRLGDRPVNRMGYGAMSSPVPRVFGPPHDPDATRAVPAPGHRARRRSHRHFAVLRTRCGQRPDPPGALSVPRRPQAGDQGRGAAGRRRTRAPAQRPDELRKGVEANLHTLRVERLDLVNLRLVETRPDGAVPLEDQLLALADMRREGKLDLIGLSNVDPATARHALEFVDIAEIQNGYSIIDRQDEEMVEFARERGIAYVPLLPPRLRASGGTTQLDGMPRSSRSREKHGATSAQIALAWLLARSTGCC